MSIDSEALNLAIELEEKGHNYYTKHYKETQNPLSRQVLKSLADQELDHIKTFKQIAEGKNISTAQQNPADDIEQDVKDVFADFSDQEKEDWAEVDTEVYEHAMELENKIYKHYEKLAQQTDDPQEKEFLEAVMEEEMKHYESLQNVLYYLTDNVNWLAEEEGKVWNWMTL
ncbi:ferritin family protein [Halanaerobaculum tunisiense]